METTDHGLDETVIRAIADRIHDATCSIPDCQYLRDIRGRLVAYLAAAAEAGWALVPGPVETEWGVRSVATGHVGGPIREEQARQLAGRFGTLVSRRATDWQPVGSSEFGTGEGSREMPRLAGHTRIRDNRRAGRTIKGVPSPDDPAVMLLSSVETDGPTMGMLERGTQIDVLSMVGQFQFDRADAGLVVAYLLQLVELIHANLVRSEHGTAPYEALLTVLVDKPDPDLSGQAVVEVDGHRIVLDDHAAVNVYNAKQDQTTIIHLVPGDARTDPEVPRG